MPTPPPSITLDPTPHPALNYAGLRAEALELLGRLCGDQWSDFNSHDPGITILEQLCYALTELAWRSQWSIEDLLASTGSDWQPAAAEILQGDPVTRDDLLALLQSLGCPEVLVERLEKPELPLYFRPSAAARALAAGAAGTGRPPVAGDLELDADQLGRPTAGPPQPVTPQGVWRVAAQLGPGVSGSGPASLLPIARRLHGARLLGRDFRLEPLDPFLVVVRAELELHAAGVAPDLLDRLRRRLDAAISEAGASGEAGGLRSAALIQTLQALPEVRRVISLGLASSRSGPFHPWHLPLAGLGARLDPASDIRLFHQGLPLRLPPAAASASNPAVAAMHSALAGAGAPAAPHPPGRRRSLSNPGSLARQLPAVYGVGPAGLPADASPERRVQALRLRAYLHFFDQLLANGHAQLAHATRLLAPVPPDDPRPLEAEAVRLAEDRSLPLTDLTDLLQGLPAAWPEALRQALGTSAPPDSANQRNALLAHLLRCFGEELELNARPPGGDEGTQAALVAARSEFLRRIVPLSAGRGSGADLLDAPPPSALFSPSAASPETSQGAFAERLRRKLGLSLDPDGTPPLLVIEHLLLRPLADDSSQRVQGGEDPIPYLSDVARPDPWSARVSVVVDASRLPALAEPDRDRWLARFIRQELPAHLRAELHLLADDPATPGRGPWSRLVAAWGRFRALLQAHRLLQLGASAPIDSALLSLRLRDSRDQLISQLRIGLPWPLRAIPLPQELMVVSHERASIPLPYSQKGVRYQLVDAASGQPIGSPAEGTDGPLTLTTTPIQNDITVRVLASVLTPGGDVALTANGRARSTLLAGEIQVVEGIDLELTLRLLDADSFQRLPLLDAAAPTEDDGLARLAHHNQRLVVEIVASQEGVRYQVIDSKSQAPLSPWANGTSGDLRLALDAGAAEDQDLAVRAHLDKRGVKEEETLIALLPLRVRANPAVPLRLLQAVVEAGAPARVVIGEAPAKKAKAQNPAALVSQSSVRYELRVRPLGDKDWDLADPLRPADKPIPPGSLTRVGGDLTGFAPRPNGPAASGQGQGTELTLETPISGEGMVVAALAQKRHRLYPFSHPNPTTLASEVPLLQAAVVYSKPDASQRLILRGEPDRPGVWTLWGGQPGVAYTLQPEAERVKAKPMGPSLAIPEGDRAPGGVRGIGRARVERDLVVNGGAGTGPAELTLDPAQAGEIWIWAHSLRSGVEVKLERPPILVWADPPGVCEGESARVVVSRLDPAQPGRLLLDGTLLREGTADAAGHLTLASGPLPGACGLQLDVGVTCPLWIARSMSLAVAVRVVDHQPLLAGAPAHLLDWDGSVLVELASSEANVAYTLINAADRDKPLQQQTTFGDPLPGNGGPLRLRCGGLRDDVDLLVRCSRVYDAAGTRRSTGFLPTILPLRVRANHTVPLRLLNAVVDPGASATVTIGAKPAGTPTPAVSGTQAGVRYHLHARPLADGDWRVDNPATDTALTTITGPLVGFTPQRDSIPGNGEVLTLEQPISGEGMVVAVQAQRRHRPFPFSHPDTSTHPSEVALRQAAVVYTKPDASRRLILRADPKQPGLWTLLGGQPGVAYTLVDNRTPNTPIPLPPDPKTTLSQPPELPIPELQDAPTGPRGIGRQRVGRDLIIGLSDSPARAVTALAQDPAAISNLRVVARFLRSGVRVELQHPPTLEPSAAVATATITPAETAKPTVWDPSLLPGLALWLDAADASTMTADSSGVSEWRDKSGAKHHVIQSNASARPAYQPTGLDGQPTIYFDKTDDVLACSKTTVSCQGDLFYGAVFEYLNDGGRWRPIVGIIADEKTSKDGELILQRISTTSSIGIHWSGRKDTGNTYAVQVTNLFTPRIATAGRSGGDALGLGGTVTVTATGPSQSTYLTQAAQTWPTNRLTTRIAIGGRQQGGTAWSNARISEVVVCNQNLSTLNRQKLEGYFARKWGLLASLPVDHPYKTLPPVP